MMLEPTQPLSVMRAMQSGGRASISIPFQEPRQVHRLVDAEVGDTLMVVTALGPARGFLKSQEFVEFNALVSTHGVVIQPLADDLVAEASPDKIVIGRPAGLTLSSAAPRAPADARRGPGEAARRSGALDPQAWGFDREANFRDRQTPFGRRRRRGERGAACAGATGACPLLPGARPDRGSQGRARRRGVRRARQGGLAPRWRCARSPTSCSGAAPRP